MTSDPAADLSETTPKAPLRPARTARIRRRGRPVVLGIGAWSAYGDDDSAASA